MRTHLALPKLTSTWCVGLPCLFSLHRTSELEDRLVCFLPQNADLSQDDIVEDARQEVEVLLLAWQTQGGTNEGGIFRTGIPRSGERGTSNSSGGNSGLTTPTITNKVRFVVSDLSGEPYSDRESFDQIRERSGRRSNGQSSREIGPGID